jgi:hypothetical protein
MGYDQHPKKKGTGDVDPDRDPRQSVPVDERRQAVAGEHPGCPSEGHNKRDHGYPPATSTANRTDSIRDLQRLD